MKIILSQDVTGIGRKGEVKNVSDGYARNFLLPNKLGQIATPAVIASAEKLKNKRNKTKKSKKIFWKKTSKASKT